MVLQCVPAGKFAWSFMFVAEGEELDGVVFADTFADAVREVLYSVGEEADVRQIIRAGEAT